MNKASALGLHLEAVHQRAVRWVICGFPVRRTRGGATHPLLLSCSELGVTWLFSAGPHPTRLFINGTNTESESSDLS
jgi:hypothetical protein